MRTSETSTLGVMLVWPRGLLFALCFLPCLALGQSLPQAEQELFHLTNDARQANGSPALVWDDKLAAAARLHADELAKHEELSHQFPDEPALKERLGAMKLRFDAAAENVGFAVSAPEVQLGFMRSPGHRENLLNPKYNAVGIGAARVGKYLYFAVDFAHRLESYDAQAMEAGVLDAFAAERKQAGLPAITMKALPALREAACAGKANALTASAIAVRFPSSDWTNVFTLREPSDIPSKLRELARETGVRRLEVGACFAPNSTTSYATFWVIALGYTRPANPASDAATANPSTATPPAASKNKKHKRR